MLETSARLLRVLSLLQTRRSWPGPELAERLQVDARTVRRDIDRLRSLGYPVRSVPGVAGGYRLEAGAHMPPLLLEDDEAVAVAVSLRTAAGGTVAGVEEAAVRALAKLEHTLPARLRPRVRAFESVTMAVSSGPAVAADVLAAAAGACRDTERLRFEYQDRGGQASTRTTEPLQLVCTGRRWYLLAWDVDRQDWRTFRVDRIGQVLSIGPRFTPRQPPEGAAAYVSRAISLEPYRYQARFIVHASAQVMA
ncbi:MAG: helix-turn-helix transcriptional regulator, partial [Chloroflexota bacterium]